MKYIWFLLVAILLMSCRNRTALISGTAKNMDGGAVSVLDLSDKILFSATIKDGKFSFGKQKLDSAGYYTFSVMSGNLPNDFEIYLEPGKYDIALPERKNGYLKIKTVSKIQNDLSAYYNFEDSVMYTFRHKQDTLTALLNDPKIKLLSAVDFNKIYTDFTSAKLRVQGAESAVMGMFVDKYPKNDIVIHVMSNQNYEDNPFGYYLVYQKLSPAAKNTAEGKGMGEKLKELLKNTK
jgi:hypothetical protein